MRSCPRCRATNATVDRFCAECGAALEPTETPRPLRRFPPELARELLALGIDPGDYPLLLVLPIFGVAWSDEKLQREEGRALLSALKLGTLGVTDQHHVIEEWLRAPLSRAQVERGLALLEKLSFHEDFSEIYLARLEESVRLCREVAASAGGLLAFGRVSSAEGAVIARLEQIISALKSAR